MKLIVVLLNMLVSSFAFRSFLKPATRSVKSFATIVQGVDFENIAREWRLKWSPDNDKKSLASAQQSKFKI